MDKRKITTTEDPGQSQQSRFYRPELDSLRFAAFVAVFIHHCAPYRATANAELWQFFFTMRYALGGGLCLFFVLSAYLITELLLRERAQTKTVHVGAFYVRRALRIWPLYFVFMVIAYLFGRAVPFAALDKGFLLRYLLFVGNWAFYVNPTNNPLGPLWSISIEEQFYLCWPLLARQFGRRGLAAISSTLIPLAILACCVISGHSDKPGLAIWTSPFTQFECFGAGAIIALVLHQRRWKPAPLWRFVLLLFGLLMWFCSESLAHFTLLQNVQGRSAAVQTAGFQMVVLGCVFIFLAALGCNPLKSGPAVFLGRISYGLYVFHMLCFYVSMRFFALIGWKQNGFVSWSSAGVMALALGMDVALAVCSYRFLEKPFLRLKERFAFIPSH